MKTFREILPTVIEKWEARKKQIHTGTSEANKLNLEYEFVIGASIAFDVMNGDEPGTAATQDAGICLTIMSGRSIAETFGNPEKKES